MKRKIILCCVLSSLALTLSANTMMLNRVSTNVIATNSTMPWTECDPEQVLHALEASKASFLKNEFNSPQYARHIAHNANHLLTMLNTLNDLPIDLELAMEYSYSILKIFNDKYKATELVDDTVVEQILREFPKALGHYFAEENEGYSLDALTQLATMSLTGRLAQCSPSTLVQPQAIANDFAALFASAEYDRQHETLSEKERMWRFRMLTTRFVDTLLSKLVWNHVTYQSIWPSFVKIAFYIKKLTKANIVSDPDTYDSMLWALVHKFSFFISLTGSALPLDFYENIEQELSSGACAFLVHEQDEVTTKFATIAHAIQLGKTMSLAHQQLGIIEPGMYTSRGHQAVGQPQLSGNRKAPRQRHQAQYRQA